MTLRVSEVFGPTAQGEGPHIGHVCAFLRLYGCNLSCSWCDTPYTWDTSRYPERENSHTSGVTEVLADIEACRPIERLVISGGEPMVQQRRLPELLEQLPGLPVDIETNGTIAPTDEMAALVDLFVVSPKVIPSAEQRLTQAHKQTALDAFRELARDGRAVFKYVAKDDADLDAIDYHSFELPRGSVYVMPEGRTVDEVVASTQRIADRTIKLGLRLSTRLHVLAWGDERGH